MRPTAVPRSASGRVVVDLDPAIVDIASGVPRTSSFDGVESGDVIERFARGFRAGACMDIEELAANLRPASNLGDRCP
nr:hypothetical protein [Sphingomonas tagetis]